MGSDSNGFQRFQWSSSKSLIPKSAPGLGDVLAAMATAPITAADICDDGTQVKILLKLQGYQKVLFKPKRSATKALKM